MSTTNKFGISGLAITTPILGRISIGHLEERKNKLLPTIDDHISITTEVRTGLEWNLHPLHVDLLQKKAEELNKDKKDDEKMSVAEVKLRSIPVTVLYDRPELNLNVNYSAFDTNTGRQLCVGDGENARRFLVDKNETQDVECLSPDYCQFAKTARCKLTARMVVKIDGQSDPHAGFIFRTTGYNSVRNLMFRLNNVAQKFGGLRGIPMNLVIRAKSTIKSIGRPVFYLDLCLRHSEFESMLMAKELRDAEARFGLDQAAFERIVAEGLANSAFVDIEEGSETIDEFFSHPEDGNDEDQKSEAIQLTKVKKSKIETFASIKHDQKLPDIDILPALKEMESYVAQAGHSATSGELAEM